MSRFRGAHYLLGIALLFGVFGGLFGGQAALAAEDNGEELQIFSRYPVLQNIVGSNFEFEVTLYYEGEDARTFDLDFNFT